MRGWKQIHDARAWYKKNRDGRVQISLNPRIRIKKGNKPNDLIEKDLEQPITISMLASDLKLLDPRDHLCHVSTFEDPELSQHFEDLGEGLERILHGVAIDLNPFYKRPRGKAAKAEEFLSYVELYSIIVYSFLRHKLKSGSGECNEMINELIEAARRKAKQEGRLHEICPNNKLSPLAVTAYVIEKWGGDNWRKFSIKTPTDDVEYFGKQYIYSVTTKKVRDEWPEIFSSGEMISEFLPALK